MFTNTRKSPVINRRPLTHTNHSISFKNFTQCKCHVDVSQRKYRMGPANEILEFPIACNVSISIMNKTKRIKRERFSFPVVWSMIEFFTFLWFAHFQLQEFTRIWMKTWSMNRVLNLARYRGFTFDFLRPFILFSRRPAMFSSVSISQDIHAIFVSWIMCWFSQL